MHLFPQTKSLVRGMFISLHIGGFFIIPHIVCAQPVTGVWKGKIRSTRIELKLIKKGDSLVGTSYYYESRDNYRRYSVKGYFDDASNSVVWWDDALIEGHSSRGLTAQDPMMAIADFNCPGEGIMKLEGSCTTAGRREGPKSSFSFQKTGTPIFGDEWDYVLENYTAGASDPSIIDSVALVALGPAPPPAGYEAPPPPSVTRQRQELPAVVLAAPPSPDFPVISGIQPQAKPGTPEEKFTSRSRTLQSVIPVTGDTIEARFYDNAEIDGDSIAVFLNGRLLEEHIGLTDQPHIIRIPVSTLEEDNELVMVAENLGSIPPNTSLMVLIVGEKRYEARLYADEHTSALVRFVKENPGKESSLPQPK